MSTFRRQLLQNFVREHLLELTCSNLVGQHRSRLYTWIFVGICSSRGRVFGDGTNEMLSTSASAKRSTSSGEMKRADRRSSITILVLGDGRLTIILLLCFCCLEMQKFRQSFRVRVPALADALSWVSYKSVLVGERQPEWRR